MIRNYIKIAWKVMLRNKFFTFISLFGISITLSVILLLASAWESTFGAYGPEKDFDRTLLVSMIMQKGEEFQSINPLSIYMIETHLANLPFVENVGITGFLGTSVCYAEGQRAKLNSKEVDHRFWEILRHQFLAGRPHQAADVAERAKLVVINRKTALDFFGTVDCVGKPFKVGSHQCEVLGVIENVSITKVFSSADVYMPYSINTTFDPERKKLSGGHMAMLLLANRADIPRAQAAFQEMVSRLPPDNPKATDIVCKADDAATATLRPLLNMDDGKIRMFYVSMLVIVLLFMLLPAMNLINLNTSRIVERVDEIGVRKAFGASVRVLIGQFVIENMFLTFLGGAIAVLVSLGCMALINQSGVIEGLHLTLRPMVLFYGLLATLVLSLLSGVYPAWRMAKTPIAASLAGK